MRKTFFRPLVITKVFKIHKYLSENSKKTTKYKHGPFDQRTVLTSCGCCCCKSGCDCWKSCCCVVCCCGTMSVRLGERGTPIRESDVRWKPTLSMLVTDVGHTTSTPSASYGRCWHTTRFIASHDNNTNLNTPTKSDRTAFAIAT